MRSRTIPAQNTGGAVDDLSSFARQSDFPSSGETGKLYLAQDTGQLYRWGGSSYVIVSGQLALGTGANDAGRGSDVAANTAKLAGIEDGAQVNVQPDWDAASGPAQILNKPAGPVTIVIPGRSVVEITPPTNGGVFLISLTSTPTSSYPQAQNTGFLGFDVGASLSLISLSLGSGMVNRGVALLDGTVSPTNTTSVAIKTGKIVVESGWDAAQTYRYDFLL